MAALTPRQYALNRSVRHCFASIGALALVLSIVGCTQERSSKVELSLNVEPTNRPGTYIVSGHTNLPDRSQIIVQGIRPLNAPTQLVSANTSSDYAILDRQIVSSSQGQWQATLKLWQVAPDGQYQEAWQLSHNQINRLQPSSDVVFVAVIDPGNQAKSLTQTLEKEGKKLEGGSVRFAADGQWYLQAKQSLAISLPTGKTVAPGVSISEMGSGWGNRADLASVATNSAPINLPPIKEKMTNIPLSPEQQLR